MYRVSQEIVPCVNENSLSGKNRYFQKPETYNIFWIYSGVNEVSVVGTGGLQERVSFFNIFTRIVAFSRYFPVSDKQKSVFWVEIKIANAKTTKTMLTECIASSLSRYTGVITRSVKENSAALN